MLHRVHPEIPLVIAANRDEFYARAATKPAVIDRGPPQVWAGTDCNRGGTWLGATSAGFFVAITNQRVYGPPDPSLRSRGEVVADALRRGSIEAVEEYVATLDPAHYNAFNLLFGDGRELRVAYARRDRARIPVEPVPPGMHTLPNDSIGSLEFPKTLRAESLVAPYVNAPWSELRPALERMLADHEMPPLDAIPAPPPDSLTPPELLQRLQALCVHTPIYGTHSATILAIEPGRLRDYRFANGHPCEVGFETMVSG
jgi:uncharacterized protein with NRDE domain